MQKYTAIKIDTKNKVSLVSFDAPLYKGLNAAFDGLVEHVRPRRLPSPYCMMVDEEGLLKELPLNVMGCFLYQTDLHGHPIASDIYILRDASKEIAGLTQEDVAFLLPLFEQMCDSILMGGGSNETDAVKA